MRERETDEQARAILALTPVAALMFRFNNPDALLVLLMTIAAVVWISLIDDAFGHAGVVARARRFARFPVKITS